MKKAILYIFIMLILLWSGASFLSQDLTRYSAYVNLSSKNMKAIIKSDFQTLMGLNNSDNNSKSTDELIYKINDRNAEVLTLKYKLYYLNYFQTQPSTDVLDSAMSEAINKYQINKGLTVTGVIDKATYDALLGEQITYVEGKTGDDIKQFQLILFYTGYLNVYPSGYYGSVTTDAVSEYQKDKSIIQSGKLDAQTQQSLKNETYSFNKGQKSVVILEMQKILIAKGYLSGTVDGTFDDNTQLAVQKFQRDNSLQVSGIMDKDTINKLSSFK
ncbi:MAG: peptidoglycan-binding protein [Eubacteriaceae bacterium]|nr:peptidoglycan-binding protein [Eubacteriaceae bacterium]